MGGRCYRHSAMTILLGVFWGHLASAESFYVAPNGVDSNPGTLSQPWATIAKANQTLAAGDTVFIRAGTYHEQINPVNSGSPGNRIVFTAYQGEPVVIDGTPDNLEIVTIYTSYVDVDGFTIRNQGFLQNAWVIKYWVNLEGSFNVLRNCRVIADGDPYVNIYTRNAASRGIVVAGPHNLVEHCFVRGQVMGIVIAGSSPRFTVIRFDTVYAVGQNNINVSSTSDGTTAYHGTLIENCVLDTSFIEDNVQFEPDYGDPTSTLHNRGTIIRHNRLGHAAENAIDLKGAGHTLIDGNIIYSDNGDDDGPLNNLHDPSGGGITTNPNSPTRYTIVRRNIIWDTPVGIECQEGDHLFNNTVLNNRRDWGGSNLAQSSIGSGGGRFNFAGVNAYNDVNYKRAFVNNIFVGQPQQSNGTGGVYYFRMDGGSSGKFFMDNNLYYDSLAPAKFYHRELGAMITTTSLANWQHELQNFSSYDYMGGKDANSLERNPLFVSAPIYPVDYNPSWDFSLQSSSPAIDAGRPLAIATNSTNGSTTLTVDDAYFFSDGFGIIEGDLIRIGTADTVRILSINYSANTLTISEPRSWHTGDGVTLDYNGLAPDIGAIELAGTPQDITTPSTPALLNPPDNATDVAITATLEWSRTQFARSYDLEVATDQDFSSLTVNKTGLPGTSFVVGGLAHSATYFWRVRAANGAGASGWTSSRAFTTVPRPTLPPPAPALVLPEDVSGGNNTELVLTWTPASAATSYHIQVSEDPNFVLLLIDHGDLADTNYNLQGLGYLRTYYWRVNATNDIGTSDWSLPRSFATGALVRPASIIRNPDFSSGTDFWRFYTNGAGTFEPSTPGFYDASCGKLTIDQGGTNIQLYQPGLILDPDSTYILSFSAYSTSGHPFDIALFKDVPPYNNYGLLPRRANLSTSWATFSIEFTAAHSIGLITDGQLQFWLAPYAAPGDVYYIDNVTIRKKGVPTPSDVPRDFSLAQNFPNPFNPVATIRYQLPMETMVKLRVYDILGRLVQTLVWEVQKAGRYQRDFNGGNLASGVYFCTLQAGAFDETIKMLLVK